MWLTPHPKTGRPRKYFVPNPSTVKPSSFKEGHDNMGELDETVRLLGNLETKMDMVIESHRDMKKSMGTHEERIRSLENHKSWLAGIAAAVGMGGSVAWDWMKQHLK